MIEFMNINLVGGFNGIINGFFLWLIMVNHNKSIIFYKNKSGWWYTHPSEK